MSWSLWGTAHMVLLAGSCSPPQCGGGDTADLTFDLWYTVQALLPNIPDPRKATTLQ